MLSYVVEVLHRGISHQQLEGLDDHEHDLVIMKQVLWCKIKQVTTLKLLNNILISIFCRFYSHCPIKSHSIVTEWHCIDSRARDYSSIT